MLFAVSALLLVQTAAIDWKKDYESALQEAQKGSRYVVVFFAGADCPPCARMGETTFKDPGVVDHVNRTYVNVYVFLDGPNPVAKQFGVEAVPTIFLVASDGTRVRKWEGYVGPEDYRKGLDGAAAAHPKLRELEAKLKLDPDSLELNTEASKLYEALGRSRSAADALRRAAARVDDPKARARMLVRALGHLTMVETDDALNEEMLAMAAEAEKLDPEERGEALAVRAQVAMNREKPGEAITLFEEVVEKHPACDKAAASLLWLADLYHHARKDNAKAKKALERILEKYPKSDVVDDAKAMLEHLKEHD
ncbi:MAG TPA: thioredoxin fold domain-containing protein [Planctomycetota bacterium]|nr:thioredoxin fold domain-containing protein [Planctomycetota bacterium]